MQIRHCYFLLLLVVVTGCSQHSVSVTATAASKVAAVTQFRPVATVQDIMQSIIDPNIDPVWDSVATISTRAGTVEKAPKTDEEWKAVRQHALVVVEASNLLLIGGRQVALPGASTSSHAVELSPAEVQKGIDAHRADFDQRANALHDAAVQVLQAIDEKRADRLVDAGGRVDQACESCHTQFWYPNDKRPI
jgi:Cytochrome C'